MGPTSQPLLPPSASLPPLRGKGGSLNESAVLKALDNLFAIYYPPSPTTIPKSVLYEAAANIKSKPYKLPAISRVAASSQIPDSGYSSPGYVSENEDDEDDDGDAELELLRRDEFERSFATRWLEKFIARASDEGDEVMMAIFESEETRTRVVERAADLLTALLNPELLTGQQSPSTVAGDGDGDNHGDLFCRELRFDFSEEAMQQRRDQAKTIAIKINDGLAGSSSSADHTDVGVQTWGASIVMCQMMCDAPSRFGLDRGQLGDSPRIVELGAGTGVVSLVMAQLLPRYLGVQNPTLVATDYHPGVMTNLRGNIAMKDDDSAATVHACTLDWAHPESLEQQMDWPLDRMHGYGGCADILVATDVVYEKEHAALLRECASRLLAPQGTFWLLQTVRSNGRFGEYADAVESAFPMAGVGKWQVDGNTSLKILDAERLEKKTGVGRGDETFYRLFRIGWA
ncbi:hypothetical protein V8F06_009875 [Rhypophila decipiens]